jgi:hypothetical protein
MKSAKKTFTWLIVGFGVFVITITFVLPLFVRAKVGSWTLVDTKLTECTNQIIKIPVKQMPAEGSMMLVLGVPEELTNSINGISGTIVVSRELNVDSKGSSEFVINDVNQSTRPNFVMQPDLPIYTAYALGEVRTASKPFRDSVIEVRFSNTPPREVSIWARYELDRYHPVYVK